MSPIIVKETNAEKIVYHGDDRSAQIKFPGALEVVPPVQFRLYSLYEMARQKLN